MSIVSEDASVRRRIQPLLWLIGIYLVIGLLSRSVLLAMAGPGVPHHPELPLRVPVKFQVNWSSVE